MEFDARIDGRTILCQFTASRDLRAPVFCFSGMAPMIALDGGTRIASLGGYTEIQLPDLPAGQNHALRIGFEDPRFTPANRAWLPLGAYLRIGRETIDLPRLPAGVRRVRPAAPEGAPPVLRLCPQPSGFVPAEGQLAATGFASDAAPLARADALARRSGLGSVLDRDGPPLTLHVDGSLPPEGYRLSISPHGAELQAADDAGAFYGGVTLATLLHTHGGQLPCGVITDAPRFGWRGQHLDCARHFYAVETILRLLDLMALLKLNRFHWHFADDEAFRLELAGLPEATRTHFRGEGELLPGLFGGGIRAGGGYSRADAARIVSHARELNIEVMPEIEVPAHALALTRVFPATRDPDDKGAEVSVQGYPKNVMNPAQPESWRVWETMAGEVSDVFPFGVVHIGGDELPPGTWAGSPAAQALMAAEGLRTTEDLQGWTMHRLAGFLSAKGKTPAAWEEAAQGKRGIEHDAILFSWTGQGPGLQAARNGYRVVMTPAQHTYLDMAHTGDVADWGANWAAVIGLEDTIAWDPVPDDEPELESHILGVQGAFWSEFTTRDAEMEPMLAPRILGVATIAWQPRGSAAPSTLAHLAGIYADVLALSGWTSAWLTNDD